MQVSFGNFTAVTGNKIEQLGAKVIQKASNDLKKPGSDALLGSGETEFMNYVATNLGKDKKLDLASQNVEALVAKKLQNQKKKLSYIG